MTESPRFTKLDADRILARAAEIEGAEDSQPLTVAELRAVATEAGFGPSAVERALAEALQAKPAEAPRTRVARRGLIFTRLNTVRTIPFQLPSEQLLEAVRLFQPYREGPARISLEEGRISWRDRKGIRFNVLSSAGVTEVRVSVSKFVLRRGRWMGWVKAAADRMESMVFLVAARGAAGAPRQLESGPRNAE
jgi:hypothetical protein